MDDLCQDIKSHASQLLVEWENLVCDQPWYSLPADHRIDSLPDVIVGLVNASLCRPHGTWCVHLRADDCISRADAS